MVPVSFPVKHKNDKKENKMMQFSVGGPTRSLPFPSWFRDFDVLEAIYNEMNRLRVAGGRTKALRASKKAAVPAFDSFVSCEIAPCSTVDGLFVVVTFSYTNATHIADWYCRLRHDYTIFTGISSWRVYDGRPIIVPARAKLKAVIRRVATMIHIVSFWRREAAAPDSKAVMKAAKRFCLAAN